MPPTGRSTSGTSRPTGRATSIYHLDPLWAHPDIDFVGIDNYMPLSDWRDGLSHADAAAGSIYDLELSEAERRGRRGLRLVLCRRGRARRPGPAADQRRRLRRALGVPLQGPGELVVDAARRPARRGEGGRRRPSGSRGRSRSGSPSSAARRRTRGRTSRTSSTTRSRRRAFSHTIRTVLRTTSSSIAICRRRSRTGAIRRTIRRRTATRAAWWTWPGRMSGPGTRGPGPTFPDRLDTWTDGTNHARGHWLNGRTSLAALAEVVAEICARCDLTAIDVGRLHGGVTGYAIEAVESGRQSLQPLMLAYAVRQLRDRRRARLREPRGRGGLGDRA